MLRRIVCYGDSNTYGYDAADFFGGRFAAGLRWPELLAAALGCETVNCGMNGRSVARRAEEAALDVRLLARHAPCELVIVMLGTNDLLFEPDAPAAARRMEDFLLALRAALPESLPLLTAPPLIHGYGDEAYEASVRLPGCYEALAGRLGIAFADSSRWQIPMGADGVHFSERGHRIFAAKMAARIRALAAEAGRD